jgi:hypothetical protein
MPVLPKLVLPAAPATVMTPRGMVPGVAVRQKPVKRVPPEYVGDPIHLTAAIANLQPGAGGAGVNVKALVNPGPGPIEVHGFKFRVRSSTYVPSGALIGCRLDLGEFPLTNGFVPIYAFGRAENPVAEQVTSGSDGGVIKFGYAQYTARLARPIYLPEGAAVRPQLQHRGQSTSPADVQISVFGRMLDRRSPLPTSLKLPYWAVYVSKSFALGLADAETSSESDLYNPFDVPLHLERFVGRINYLYAIGVNESISTELEGESLAQVPSLRNYMGDALAQLLVTITDSNGFPVVKRPTPFRLVFDHYTRSWPLTHQLPPRGFYRVELTNTAPFFAGVAQPVTLQPTISMMGWREVEE